LPTTWEDWDAWWAEATPRKTPLTNSQHPAWYLVAAQLPDGQVWTGEGHVGDYADVPMTRTAAEAAVEYLDYTRPEGHEDVQYVIIEA